MSTKANQVIFGMPPEYTASCDMPLFSENPYLGGATYQSKWGRISKDRSSITDTRLYPVTFTVGSPKSILTLDNTIGGIQDVASGGSNRLTKNGLKTFDFGPARDSAGYNMYIQNIYMLIEMLGYGELLSGIKNSMNSFLIPDIVKVGTNFDARCRFPKVTLMASEETNITETVQNDVSSSLLESILGGGSKMAREFNFIRGLSTNSAQLAEELKSGSEDQSMNPLVSMAKGLGSQALEMSNKIIGEDLTTSLTNGNQIILPKIWQQSSFTKTYTIQVRLFSPYSHRYSLAQNIFVPLAYIFGFGLPSQPTNSSIGSPLLVKVDSPGAFSIPLGVVTNISLKKGGKLDLWTYSGQFRALDVTIEIADLFDKIPIPLKTLYDKDGDDSAIRNYLASITGGSIPDEKLHAKQTIARSKANYKSPEFKKNWSTSGKARESYDFVIPWSAKTRRREQTEYDKTQTDTGAIRTASITVSKWMEESTTKVNEDTGNPKDYKDIKEKIEELSNKVGKKDANKQELADEYKKVYNNLLEYKENNTLTTESSDMINQQLTMLSKASAKMDGLNRSEQESLSAQDLSDERKANQMSVTNRFMNDQMKDYYNNS